MKGHGTISEDGMSTYLEWEDGIKFQVRENKTALVCGVADFGVIFYIFIMRLLYPSERGGGALLYLPLFCMLLGGVACFLMYINRKLIVEEMDICYVNWIGKKKPFTLDEIGYCQIKKFGAGEMNQFVVYDLLGHKLCKLEIGMRGLPEFYQYLLDNGVRIERIRLRARQSSVLLKMVDAILNETAVCEEEIRKCSEYLYRELEKMFRDWEDRHKQFEAVWEFGFAEYKAEDLERKCPLYRYPSSVGDYLEHIPESYECLFEAYLKREDGYVVNKRGETVSIMLPYLSKTKSYQIGEKTRIRKTDEEWMKEWLSWQLKKFAEELPKHKYHTETLALGHRLRTTAGLTVKALPYDEQQKAENMGL